MRARLHEQAGHLDIAADHYTRAAAQARSTAERDYLTKQAAGRRLVAVGVPRGRRRVWAAVRWA